MSWIPSSLACSGLGSSFLLQERKAQLHLIAGCCWYGTECVTSFLPLRWSSHCCSHFLKYCTFCPSQDIDNSTIVSHQKLCPSGHSALCSGTLIMLGNKGKIAARQELFLFFPLSSPELFHFYNNLETLMK